MFIKTQKQKIIFILLLAVGIIYLFSFLVVSEMKNGFKDNLNVLLASDELFSSTTYLSKRLVEFEKIHVIRCFKIKDENNFVLLDSSYRGRCRPDLIFLSSLPFQLDLSLISGKKVFIEGFFSPPLLTRILIHTLQILTLFFAYWLATKIFRDKEALNRLVRLETKKLEEFKNLSKQIAHDAKNPLSVMTILSSSSDLSDNMRNLLKIASDRIRESISELQAAANEVSSFYLEEPIRNTIKEFQLTHNAVFELTGDAKDLNVRGSVNEFERILSNIILNSLEAKHPISKPIKIFVSNIEGTCRVAITDNGHGMPSDIAATVGRKRITYGKTNGQGLGLSYAYDSIRRWGGELTISTSPAGTSITLYLKIT